MIVNPHDKSLSHNFIKGLSAKLASDEHEGLYRFTAVHLDAAEVETLMSIVDLQNNFCLHSFDYLKHLVGFSVYNLNEDIPRGGRTPVLKFTELNVPGQRYINQLCELACTNHNMAKLCCVNLEPKLYIPHTNRPESYGLKFMSMKDLI